MDYLFSRGDLHSLIQDLEQKVIRDVDVLPEDVVLKTSPTDLVEHFVTKYQLDVPTLHRDAMYVEHRGDVSIDVSGDPFVDVSPGSTVHVRGSEVTIAVPFSGNRELFQFRPNTFTLSPPRAEVTSDELHLTYADRRLTSEGVKARYTADVGAISQWLDWMRDQARSFNDRLEAMVRNALDQRRERVLADRNMVESLGLPIRKRPGEAETYKVPDVQRKAKIVKQQPQPTREPYTAEPALDENVLEEIVGIVKGMAHVMERSPSAFKEMGEEDLRQHFLVQLNGQFEGGASGETFNYEGKTDILIRRDDKNVFIAECKFWGGPKTLTETIDQILGYLAWRDTKAAIILFVRNKNFSDVVAKIVPVVEAHPNHKKTVAILDETDFRFIFGQRDDPNREIQLAVLLFPVPTS